MDKEFHTIALIGKYQSPEIADSLHALVEFLRSRGRKLLVEEGTAASVGSFGCAVATFASQAGAAAAENKAANKALDAQQSALDAKRFQKLAEMHQQQLQEEGEIIKTIVESKNKTVDAVLQMLNAMFASSVKLMSAAVAR